MAAKAANNTRLNKRINKMMTATILGCVLGLMFVATVKGIQHNNKVMKGSSKLHEENTK